MLELNDRPLVAFDIDSTIIWWDLKAGYPTVDIEVDGQVHTFSVHQKHVEALKKHSSRGTNVLVWSAAGSAWGKAVVKALALEKYVDLIMPKPSWIYDDLSPNQFLPFNLYIEGDCNDSTTKIS
jgi:phosphoserine phosphatase